MDKDKIFEQMVEIVREVAKDEGVYINEWDDGYWADCQYCGASSKMPGHYDGCIVTKAQKVMEELNERHHSTQPDDR